MQPSRALRRDKHPAQSSPCVSILVGALTLFCASCRGASAPPIETITLRVGTALPQVVLPGVGIPAVIGSLWGEALVSVGWDGRTQPRICDEWEWNGDHTVLRLKIHPGVYFHDGTLLTASLAADFIRQAVAKKEAVSFQSITDVRASSQDWLEIRLSRPEAFLLSDLAGSTLRRGDGPVGTGPFVVEPSRDRSKSTVLTAFDKYYRGRPQLDRIEVKAFPTQRSAWAAMMRGELTMLHEVSRESIDFIEKESSVRTYKFTRPYYYPLVFNVRHGALRHAAVRQALSQAVDRVQLIKVAMRNQGVAAEGPIWPYHWAFSASNNVYTYNAEAARLRLEAAGFSVKKAAVAGGMPSRLRFSCMLWSGDPQFERLALLIQKQLFDIGVDMEVEAVEINEFISRVRTGRFDALLFELTTGRSLTWPYQLFHSPAAGTVPFLDSGYRAADEVLDRMRHSVSDADTRAAVSDLQRVLYDDPPAVFIALPLVSRAVTSAISVPAEEGRDVMGSLWQWRVQPAPLTRR